MAGLSAIIVVFGRKNPSTPNRFKVGEIKLLGHHADFALGRRQIGIDGVTEHRHLARRLFDQGANDPDGGRLASTVGPEQGEKIPLGHLEVNSLEGFKTVAVDLAQSRNCQGWNHNWNPVSCEKKAPILPRQPDRIHCAGF